MKHASQFRMLDQPWLLEDDMDRLRYLINHLVWFDTVCQAYVGENWLVAKNSEGQRVIPLWPDEECARVSINDNPTNTSFVTLTKERLLTEVIEKLYDDELIAVFPDGALKYEMLDGEEFMSAVDYATDLKADG